MDLIANLSIGLSAAVTPANLLYCLLGCIVGTLVGVLPGLGPAATIAMLLPVTFALPADSALIMLAGIYYGAQYGGSTTAILLKLPGEASSVVTTLDGNQMALQGRAGVALATAAIGSFVAGSIATLLLAVSSAPMAALALKFGPADYFSLMVLGLIASVVLAQGSLIKALAMIVFGILVGIVGADIQMGVPRFTFGRPELLGGIELVAVAMGMFGLGEIIANLQRQESRRLVLAKMTSWVVSRSDLKAMAWPILRGTGIGSILGILPGGGATLGAFASYAVEKKLAKDPSRFGHGAIEGVAGPESANNAGAQTSFIPMLTLGIPSNVIMALMASAMIIQGVQPGPAIIRQQPELFWGLIVSMWIGNFMLVILNLPLIRIWVKLITIPYHLLYPSIMVFCAIGVFTLNNSTFDIYIMVLFGLVGYILANLGCELAPMLLGMMLGPQMEEYFRQAMLLSRGDPLVFVQRPISASLLVLICLAIVLIAHPSIKTKRKEAFTE